MSEAARLNRQCAAILERLRLGPVTNRELAVEMGILKYTSRLSELRQAGHNPQVVARDYDTGAVTYALVPRTGPEQLGLWAA